MTIHDQRKIIKSQKGITLGDCKIATKGRVCYRRHCHGPDDRRGIYADGYHYQTEFVYLCKNII